MFLHGIGNFSPLVVDPETGVWPDYIVLLVICTCFTLIYRQLETDLTLPLARKNNQLSGESFSDTDACSLPALNGEESITKERSQRHTPE